MPLYVRLSIENLWTSINLCDLSGTLYYKVTDISVRVGSAEIMKGGVVHQLAAIFNNPRFDPYFYDYDFAILKLATPIVLGPNKAAVRLPKLNEAIAAGTATLVTGWGLTKSADSNQFLRGVVVPTYDHATCDEIYIYDGGVTPRMVCAGSLGKDSCNVSFVFLIATLELIFSLNFNIFRGIQVS